MLISSYLSDDSKVIFRRDIRERVQELAPFLTLDTDPYPVIIDGRIKYVIDGYTSTSVYPYGEHVDFRGSSAQLHPQLREGRGRRLRRHRHDVPDRHA